MFSLIAKYYRMGIYTDADIDMYVKSGNITDEQAHEIKEVRWYATTNTTN